ncbi:anaerobic ribonucleoside-triphosphate reductase activating protein [bacterium]|nr:anaerobic ribonucleoside-triphosphate reductase activating protein [bacterium]
MEQRKNGRVQVEKKLYSEMKIGDLQKTSLIEYPGKLSCIVFTQGCNFRCPFCHNPQLVLPEKFLPPMSEKDVLDFLNRRKSYLDAVVITGGEPCLQEGLPEFLKKAKEMGYFCKVDTNGTNPEMVSLLIKEKLVDYIAMDIKAPLTKYGLLTGVAVDTKNIEASVSILKDSTIDYEFKTTVLFPLLNYEDFEDIGRLIKDSPIHYLQRFVPNAVIDKKCLSYPLLTEESFEKLKQIMLKYVKECYIR